MKLPIANCQLPIEQRVPPSARPVREFLTTDPPGRARARRVKTGEFGFLAARRERRRGWTVPPTVQWALGRLGLGAVKIQPACLAARRALGEREVFPSDLLTAHEPKMRKCLKINERLLRFMGRRHAVRCELGQLAVRKRDLAGAEYQDTWRNIRLYQVSRKKGVGSVKNESKIRRTKLRIEQN